MSVVLVVFAPAAAFAPAGAAGLAGAVRPAVSKLSTAFGSTLGGTRVRVEGRGLGGARWVEFGSRRARIVARPGASAVVVVSPAHASGLVDVRVSTGGGLSALAPGDRYRYLAPPLQVEEGDDDGGTYWCARAAAWLRCWGDGNFDGVLGNGTTTYAKSPRNVKSLGAGVRDITAGDSHTCAVTRAGAAKCWGAEESGQLGNGVYSVNQHVATPVAVHGLGSGVVSIDAGSDVLGYLTCAVLTSGVVKCWGDNLGLELGPGGGTSPYSTMPVTIPGLPPVKAVSVGGDFVCALTRAGAVYCWGGNDDGVLGLGPTVITSATPHHITGLGSGVKAISAGYSTVCAVTSAKAVKCWGSNQDGVLGAGRRTLASSTVPIAVKTLGSGQAALSVGSDYTACALSTVGGVKCWGYNYDGTLGNGSTNDSYAPVQVKGMTRGAKSVKVGTSSVCSLSRTGQVNCWGDEFVNGGSSHVPVTLPWYR